MHLYKNLEPFSGVNFSCICRQCAEHDGVWNPSNTGSTMQPLLGGVLLLKGDIAFRAWGEYCGRVTTGSPVVVDGWV